MVKLAQHTHGSHIYMKMQLDNKRIEEIDVYLTNNGKMIYRTSADHGAELDTTEEEKQKRIELREAIIQAFNELY